MFVRFNCGCIGLLIGPAALAEVPHITPKSYILISACDSDDHELTFYVADRVPYDPTFSPLDFEQVDELAARLHNLIRDGYKYRTIRSLLK